MYGLIHTYMYICNDSQDGGGRGPLKASKNGLSDPFWSTLESACVTVQCLSLPF